MVDLWDVSGDFWMNFHAPSWYSSHISSNPRKMGRLTASCSPVIALEPVFCKTNSPSRPIAAAVAPQSCRLCGTSTGWTWTARLSCTPGLFFRELKSWGIPKSLNLIANSGNQKDRGAWLGWKICIQMHFQIEKGGMKCAKSNVCCLNPKVPTVQFSMSVGSMDSWRHEA